MGPELRIDPLSGEKVLVGGSPGQLLTPEATDPATTADPELFAASAAHGSHEVIERGPGEAGPLRSLGAAGMASVVDAWRARMRAHADARYLHLGVDERPGAPASASLYALPFVPHAIARERERFTAYANRRMGSNLLGDLVQAEVRLRERLIAVDEEAVAIAGFAARVPYGLMIAPRRPRARFEDEGPSGAALLHDVLGRLARVLGEEAGVSLWVRTAPAGAEHWCWRIDVAPGPVAAGALELGAALHANGVAPEQAAAELRQT